MTSNRIGIRPPTLAVALALAPAAAHADAFDDCRQGRLDAARLAACAHVIATPSFGPTQKAVAYRQQGRAKYDAGALDRAEADLAEAIRLDPTNATAWLLRAQVRVNRNDVANAISDFDAAIRLSPQSPTAYTGLGHAHLLLGNHNAAIADFTQVLALTPESASALNNRGLAYHRAGDSARAIDDFSAAIAKNPIYALPYNNRGYVYEVRGDRESAIRDFSQALLLDPSLTGARQGLDRLRAGGSLAEESGRLVAAGKAVVETHCSRCHQTGRAGDSPKPKAPPFRLLHARHPSMALREPLTRGIAAPHDEMPKFTLANSEIDKIIAYINALGP